MKMARGAPGLNGAGAGGVWRGHRGLAAGACEGPCPVPLRFGLSFGAALAILGALMGATDLVWQAAETRSVDRQPAADAVMASK